MGKKNLEVRPLAVNKGQIVKRILAAYPAAEFVFCAGDDKTDEDMFRALTAVNRAGESHLSHDVQSRSPTSPAKEMRALHAAADKMHHSTQELAVALGADSKAEPDQTVNPVTNEHNDQKSFEHVMQDDRVLGEPYQDSEEELAPHPWEAAMAIGAPARTPASANSPMLLPDVAAHPFALYTVTVGPANKKTIAHWHVDEPENIINVLSDFASVQRT